MKNKKGFTLVELLAAITILAILAVISVVAVESTLSDSQQKATKIQEESIISAAKAYVADNLTACKTGCIVDVYTLIEGGFLEEKNDVTITGIVIVNKNGNKYSYNYIPSSEESDFTVDSSGALTKYEGTNTEILIPKTIGEVTITSIGTNVFSSKNLTSVVIPDSITTVSSGAFANNPNLTEIIIKGKSSVTDFNNANGLTELSGVNIIYQP